GAAPLFPHETGSADAGPSLCPHVSFFFFFQAEDGIRAKLGTGVQTCALPIYQRRFDVDMRPLRVRARAHERLHHGQIGRASCRERVSISLVRVSLTDTID